MRKNTNCDPKARTDVLNKNIRLRKFTAFFVVSQIDLSQMWLDSAPNHPNTARMESNSAQIMAICEIYLGQQYYTCCWAPQLHRGLMRRDRRSTHMLHTAASNKLSA